jgi:hypothetical protein
VAVARLGAGAGGANGTGTVTFNSFNITSSDNATVAIVCVGLSPSSNVAATCGVTYGGVAMTQLDITNLGSSSTTRNARGIYYLVKPPTGTQSIVVTGAGPTFAGVRAQMVGFSGVGAIGAVQTASATTHAPTSVANGYDVRVLVNGSVLSAANQTVEYQSGASVTGVGDYMTMQTAAGTGSTISFTNTGTASTPGSSAVALSPVTAAKADTLTDNFATQDNAKWTYSAGASVVSGQLNITADANFYYIVSGSKYDLIGSSVVVEVPQAANGGANPGYTWLRVGTDLLGSNDNLLSLHAAFGVLRAQRVQGNVETLVQTDAYNATTHRWLRIRESAGSIYWDYSADGLSWTNYRTDTTTILLGSLDIMLRGGADSGSYTAQFDNFNVAPTVSVVWTPRRINQAPIIRSNLY